VKCSCVMIFKTGRKPRGVGADGRSKIHQEYKIWSGIACRCRPPSVKKSSIKYMGRPFKISSEWASDFYNFLEDMGPRPGPRHSVDRIDGTRGYCKHNCRWATPLQQCLNRDISKKDPRWPLGVTKKKNEGYVYRRTMGGKEITFMTSEKLSRILKLSKAFERFEKDLGLIYRDGDREDIL
jgi:hypothetical protein